MWMLLNAESVCTWSVWFCSPSVYSAVSLDAYQSPRLNKNQFMSLSSSLSLSHLLSVLSLSLSVSLFFSLSLSLTCPRLTSCTLSDALSVSHTQQKWRCCMPRCLTACTRAQVVCRNNSCLNNPPPLHPIWAGKPLSLLNTYTHAHMQSRFCGGREITMV